MHRFSPSFQGMFTPSGLELITFLGLSVTTVAIAILLKILVRVLKFLGVLQLKPIHFD